MKRCAALVLVAVIAGCQFAGVSTVRTGPAILAEPEPSLMVVRIPSDGEGEPEVSDMSYHIIGLTHATPFNLTLYEYKIDYFDLNNNLLPALELQRRTLPAPITVQSGQEANQRFIIELDAYRPVVGEHGGRLLSTLPETANSVITARVVIFGRDQAGGESEVSFNMPIRFKRNASSSRGVRDF